MQSDQQMTNQGAKQHSKENEQRQWKLDKRQKHNKFRYDNFQLLDDSPNVVTLLHHLVPSSRKFATIIMHNISKLAQKECVKYGVSQELHNPRRTSLLHPP